MWPPRHVTLPLVSLKTLSFPNSYMYVCLFQKGEWNTQDSVSFWLLKFKPCRGHLFFFNLQCNELFYCTTILFNNSAYFSWEALNTVPAVLSFLWSQVHSPVSNIWIQTDFFSMGFEPISLLFPFHFSEGEGPLGKKNLSVWTPTFLPLKWNEKVKIRVPIN